MSVKLDRYERIGIRLMQPGDVDDIVVVHLESFPGFFLSFLGPAFLHLLYESIRCDPEGVVFVACAGERVLGVAAGVEHQSAFYRRLIAKKKWTFARASLPAALRSPSTGVRLLRALQKPCDSRASAAEACILSLAVSPALRGSGTGEKLVRAVCSELSRRRASQVCLMTDRDGNEWVNRFYRGLGFRLARTYVTPEGRAMNEYLISLPDAAGNLARNPETPVRI
jgi:GNAT superfamily N-acetyltransferase